MTLSKKAIIFCGIAALVCGMTSCKKDPAKSGDAADAPAGLAAPAAPDAANAPAAPNAPVAPAAPDAPAAPSAPAANAAAITVSPVAQGSAWDKSQPNAYLAYVPANAATVIASTRNLDMNTENLKNMAALWGKILQSMVNVIKSQFDGKQLRDSEKPMVDAMFGYFDKMISICTDYGKAAAEWGLDPVGHSDIVAYVADGSIVAKVGVVDPKKLHAQMMDVIHSFMALFDKQLVQIPEKCAATMPKNVETDLAGQKWQVIDLRPFWQGECVNVPEKAYPYVPKIVALHYATDTMTAVMTWDEAVPTGIIEKAAAPFDVKKFGDAPADSVTLAYVDHRAFLAKILAIPNIKKELFGRYLEDAELETCASELTEIVGYLPESHCTTRVATNGSMLNSCTADVPVVARGILQSLASAHANLTRPDSNASFSMNLNVPNAIDALQKLAFVASSRNYKCPTFARATRDLAEMAPALSDPKFAAMTKGIQGFQIVLHTLDLRDPSQSNGAAVLTGTDVPTLWAHLQNNVPELKSLDIKKDAVSPVNLDKVLGMPLTGNGTLTNTDLVIATNGNDVKAISVLPKENDGRIFEFMFSSDMYNLFGAISGGIDLGLPPFNGVASVGVNATGLESSFDLVAK